MFALLFSLVASNFQIELNEERKFISWMRENNQFYTGNEYYLRLGLFLSHARWCEEFNGRKGLTFKVAVNQFSCLTPAEYKAILGARSDDTIERPIVKAKSNVPDSIDWRSRGVVNQIKIQASCGSCWAFSAIATSESAYAISTGKLLRFSEQNIVDCCRQCFGCYGGWTDVACKYVIEKQEGKFNTETDYPYTAKEGSCVYNSQKAIGEITKIVTVAKGDEEDLKEKVGTLGVASVSISADNAQFRSYAGGILDDDECEGAYINHAVACVGYGSENGIDYWIVRNSWGTTWGEEGYVRMIRNKNNQCLIASKAFVAVD